MKQVGKFLSSLYRDDTITAITEEAINGNYQIAFIIRDTGQERVLSRGDLSAIRDVGFNNKAEIEIEAPSFQMVGHVRQTISFGRRQGVGYSDLRANPNTFDQIRKEFGDGDKGKDNEIAIALLSPKEKEDRKQQITNLSLEKRSKFIKLRGDEIYSELEKKYRAKFNKEVVAEFIRQEERPLYESAGIDLPPVGSYLKHTRATKKAERSVSK